MKNDKKLKSDGLATKIYDCEDYRAFIKDFMSLMKDSGRGAYQRLAQQIRVHSTLVSQVMGGKKDFSLEQGLAVADYLGLSGSERDFFMLLLQRDKAGTKDLKDYFEGLIGVARQQQMKISSRLSGRKSITHEAQALYYSDWKVIAIWLATSLGKGQTPGALSKRLGIPLSDVQWVLAFLLEHGLCQESQGKYSIGIAVTHLDSSSHLVARHHTNWRLKAIENFADLRADELAFTAPMSLSKADLQVLRQKILDFIEECGALVAKSPEEELACLNVDLFTF